MIAPTCRAKDIAARFGADADVTKWNHVRIRKTTRPGDMAPPVHQIELLVLFGPSVPKISGNAPHIGVRLEMRRFVV